MLLSRAGIYAAAGGVVVPVVPAGTLLSAALEPIASNLVFFAGSAPSGSSLIARDQVGDAPATLSPANASLARANGSWLCAAVSSTTAGWLRYPQSTALRGIGNQFSVWFHGVFDPVTIPNNATIFSIPWTATDPAVAPFNVLVVQRGASSATSIRVGITDADTGVRVYAVSVGTGFFTAGEKNLVITWNGALATPEARFYLAGALDSTDATSVPNGPLDWTSTQPLALFQYSTTAPNTEGIDGACYSLGIWNRVLSLSEVQALNSDPRLLQQPDPVTPPAEGFIVTDIAITTGSHTFKAASCDNWPFVTGHDNTVKASYGDGDPVLGNANRRPIGFVSLPSSYAGGDYAITQIAPIGTGPTVALTLDGVSGHATGGARGKCYALFRVGTAYYALVGEQPDWTANDSDQFKNVRLWKSTNLIAWTTPGDVDWPISEADDRSYAWKLPSSVGGDNVFPTRDGYFYFISAGNTGPPGDPGSDRFLSSNDMILARVPDNVTAVEARTNYQFLSGGGGDSPPSWSNNFASRIAIPDLSGTLVNHWCNFIDYFPDIDRYVLWRNRRSNPQLDPAAATALEVLEAPNPWGKWRRIALFDPWQIPGNPASNRYIFTWTVPQLWASPVVVTGSTWTKNFILAYSGRRVAVDGVWDGLNTTTAQLSGTVGGPASTAPVNTAPPTISPSSPTVGDLVTASPGTWSGNPAPTFTFQMLRNGVDISGASASGVSSMPYTTTTADSSAAQPSLAVRVTASNGVGGPVSVTSTAVTVEAGVIGDVNLTTAMTVSAINTAIAGATVNDVISFGPGTYTGLATITPKNGQTYVARDGPGTVTLNGNAVPGGIARRAFNGQFGPTSVTIRGLNITNYWSGFQLGGSGPTFSPIGVGSQEAGAQQALIHGEGPDEDTGVHLNWVIEDCEIVANYGVGIRAGNGMRISRCELSNNAHLGVAGPRQDLILEDSSLRNNCRWHMNSGWESGAVKWGGGATPPGQGPIPKHPNKGHIIRRCKIANNFGPGLWFDWDCVNTEINNNSIWGNTASSIILECDGGFHVHHNQFDSPDGASGFWSFRACFSFQNTKRTVLENNLMVVRAGAEPTGLGSQNRGDGGGPQGGVYVGWFTGTQNTILNNVYLMVANGAFGTDFSTPAEVRNIPTCTGFFGASMDGIDSLVNAPPQGEIVREWDGAAFVPGVQGTSNFKCFLPAAGDPHLNVSTNNTYRMAGTTNPTRWSFDTGQTIVLSANPAGSVPNWEVLPTWTTAPPGK